MNSFLRDRLKNCIAPNLTILIDSCYLRLEKVVTCIPQPNDYFQVCEIYFPINLTKQFIEHQETIKSIVQQLDIETVFFFAIDLPQLLALKSEAKRTNNLELLKFYLELQYLTDY